MIPLFLLCDSIRCSSFVAGNESEYGTEAVARMPTEALGSETVELPCVKAR
ncbi:MAG: hypothetical protein ACI4F7_06855 [Acutalibacteraceae bacterium]